MIGRRLSHYRITAKLGAGGMGEVYLAQDLDLKRSVALKVLSEEFSADEERVQRFQREAEVLAGLDHPNIVTIHSIEEADGVRFFTMQHVEGEELSTLIPGTGMQLDRFLDLAIPLADALAAAHDRGVLHRDLKPANVMVSGEGRVRVLDFGLAKLRQRDSEGLDTQLGTEMMTQEGRILGTVAYMSPEQAQGKTLDARSDLFSLGVILHEMATGSRPFEGDNPMSLLSSIVKDTPSTITESRPELPRQLGRIVSHALEKEPEQRFQSAKDLRNELSDLRREAESGKRWLPLAVAALAILVLVIVGLEMDRIRDRLPDTKEPEVSEVIEALSIAVLPFQNLSPDPENEYFSHGMTEELVSKLSRIQILRVRSTPLGWARGEQRRIEEIGQELGVRFLLEGSVRKAGDRVRITAKLIDASTAFHLWSEDFDGELEDVFAVQEETALRIAEALDVELSPKENEAVRDRYTENPEAYDEYLRGWALIESFHIHQGKAEERLDAAAKHFARALQLDSDYALALAGQALVDSYTFYLGVDTDEARLERAAELGGRALALDPGLPEALIALGQVSWLRGDYPGSADRLRQALRRDPDNGYVWCELAAACNSQDPPQATQAEEASRNAIRFQPGYTWGHGQLGYALESQERYQEALVAYRHSVELNPDFKFGHLGLGTSLLALGEYEAALAHYERARELGESAYLLVDIGAAHAALGNRERALTILENAIEIGYEDIAALEANPHFSSLRDDPRFEDLLSSN